uniref:Uncharacterized protein n=1 Tax=Tanacetum cinerariifolium TaxID=118510 RepID=A0A6L2LW81_TANCI|nr:hypothetical protein [Tanacetum cinerariifolium]
MMIYLRNMAGFKMDYFKGMSYNDIRPIFKKYFNSNVDFLEKIKEQMGEEDSKALKRISESQEDKAEKRQKLDEEVAELRRHLQIVPNDEYDVYTEATPLALKVPVVDYEIYTEHNKPYNKIKRADDDFAGREEISTYKVHSGSDAHKSRRFYPRVVFEYILHQAQAHKLDMQPHKLDTIEEPTSRLALAIPAQRLSTTNRRKPSDFAEPKSFILFLISTIDVFLILA